MNEGERARAQALANLRVADYALRKAHADLAAIGHPNAKNLRLPIQEAAYVREIIEAGVEGSMR